MRFAALCPKLKSWLSGGEKGAMLTVVALNEVPFWTQSLCIDSLLLLRRCDRDCNAAVLKELRRRYAAVCTVVQRRVARERGVLFVNRYGKSDGRRLLPLTFYSRKKLRLAWCCRHERWLRSKTPRFLDLDYL